MSDLWHGGDALFAVSALFVFGLRREASDGRGRPLEFGNTSFSGGFVAWYADTGEIRESHVCFIDGVCCRADEARFGGIVIQVE